MDIDLNFRVSVPIDEAWRILLDLERVSAYVPGAALVEVRGDEHHGVVKMQFGAITAEYQGAARLESVDEATHTAIIVATGRDVAGQGNASATIELTLGSDGIGTHVDVDIDVSITGTVGQFGHDVIAGVAATRLAQFAENLERDVGRRDLVDLTRADLEADPEPREAASMELLEPGGTPILARAAPLLGLVLAALVAGWLARRRNR